MLRATELAHILIRQAVTPGDWVVDATVGNGHDTLFLAERVGPSGRVLGFDVQKAAIERAAELVEAYPQVTLVRAGHEQLEEYLGADLQAGAADRLAAVMFNLGYLPGGPRNIVTRGETTIAALEQALANLKEHGLVTLVLYPGHPGGSQEAEMVRSYVQGLADIFSVNRYARINPLRPAPELIAIERTG